MIRNILLLIASVVTLNSCETLSTFPTSGSSVTESEAGEGIRQALAQGVTTAIFNLNRQDGFFGNQIYKLLLPPDAQKVERTFRNLGLGKQVDKAILQINRAAEDAVGYAKPIFVDAIREMTITDAINVVRGGRNSATEYFRQKTRNKLIDAFSPVIHQSLDKLDATRYYSDLINAYNNFPTTGNKINPDLAGYVVDKATDALFDQIEKEEANIRANPVARTTEILKKVFGTLGR